MLADTGKSLSEALIFASTNSQYDDRLFIFHENCKLRTPAEHVVYSNCCFCFALTFRTILVHNMFCRCCELLKKIYLYEIQTKRPDEKWTKYIKNYSLVPYILMKWCNLVMQNCNSWVVLWSWKYDDTMKNSVPLTTIMVNCLLFLCRV